MELYGYISPMTLAFAYYVRTPMQFGITYAKMDNVNPLNFEQQNKNTYSF